MRDWYRENRGWFWFAFLVAFGVMDLVFDHDDNVVWVMNFGLAVLFLYLYQWGPWKPKPKGGTVPEARAPLSRELLLKGVEPVPIPGEDIDYVKTPHSLGEGGEGCGICAAFIESKARRGL